MVALLDLLSSSRCAVAFDRAASSSLISVFSSSTSCPSLSMSAASASICADSCSICAVNSSLVTLLSCRFLSHQACSFASSAASFSRRSISSEIISLTLAMGSRPAPTVAAINERLSLLSRAAADCKKVNSFSCLGFCKTRRDEPNWTNAVEDFCKSLYFSELPETVSDDKISIAFPIALISSPRVSCRNSNSSEFFVHSAFRSSKNLVSSECACWVSASNPCASAEALLASARDAAFSALVCLSNSTLSVKSIISISYECARLASAVFNSAFSSLIFLLISSIIPMIAPMWDEYAAASGAPLSCRKPVFWLFEARSCQIFLHWGSSTDDRLAACCSNISAWLVSWSLFFRVMIARCMLSIDSA
mmetsp:Transcript_3468/g.7836  ORF Transcript_3468/g.7836 Transcript_3468/m.7836 type:complete len:364 (-) Transcript_3468:455-1546(-)